MKKKSKILLISSIILILILLIIVVIKFSLKVNDKDVNNYNYTENVLINEGQAEPPLIEGIRNKEEIEEKEMVKAYDLQQDKITE